MLRRDRLRHGRRACPAGHRRHGGDELRRDIPAILGIPKERAQAVDDALHCRRRQALGLPLHESDDVDSANSAQINCAATEALHKKLLSDLPVALNRGARKALLLLQVVPEVGGKIVARCRCHARRRAHAQLAQVANQVNQLAPLLLPSGDAHRPAQSPPTVLVLGEVNLAEILKISSLSGQPAIKCRRMPGLDVDDGGNVLLVDQ